MEVGWGETTFGPSIYDIRYIVETVYRQTVDFRFYRCCME